MCGGLGFRVMLFSACFQFCPGSLWSKKSGLCLNTSLINIHELSTNCHRFRRQCCRFGQHFVAISGDCSLYSRRKRQQSVAKTATKCCRFGQLLLLFSATFVAWCRQAIQVQLQRQVGGSVLQLYRTSYAVRSAFLAKLRSCCSMITSTNTWHCNAVFQSADR